MRILEPFVSLLGTVALGVFITGCQHMRFPDPPTQTDRAHAVSPSGEPSTGRPPAKKVMADSSLGNSWSETASLGRAALRSQDLETAEAAYVRSLMLTEGFSADDVRVETALGNLATLAGLYQSRDDMEASGQLVELLVGQIQLGRAPAFRSTGGVLARQAYHRKEQEDSARAAHLYEIALGLDGSEGASYSQERTFIQYQLADLYLVSDRSEEAGPLLADVIEIFLAQKGSDSASAAKALLSVADYHYAHGDIQQAEEDYRRVLDHPEASVDQKLRASTRLVDSLSESEHEGQTERLKANLQEEPETFLSGEAEKNPTD